jgi:hypothetical protein
LEDDMTRTLARAALLLALTACLGGCTTVRVAHPMGDSPAMLDPVEWNGTWCDAKYLAPPADGRAPSGQDADCVALTVVDAAGGVVDVVSPSEPGDTYRAHFRHIADDRDAMFVSIEDGAAFDFELRARVDGNLLIAWDVSGDAFAEEVAAGRMVGRVEDGSVQLDRPTAAVLARIASRDGGLFDWTHPLVLVRVRD